MMVHDSGLLFWATL